MALLREAAMHDEKAEVTAWQIAAQFALSTVNMMSISEYKLLITEMKVSPKKPSSFVDQIRSRGDLMILPDASELGVSGRIAWVRHIWQVSVSDIALKTSDVSYRKGERIARLDSPYRYRLTQLMAQVFADIGLPDFVDCISFTVEENLA
ncbi:MAG: hypothetical protein Q8Q62_14085 [Mesorhizobium sp.]|nr:hypothetical protein [Mesorhizobium sp.]